MAATTDGRGYWLVTRSGSVFAAGDAVYRGSAATPLGSAVVGMASTPDGRGYWLVTAKGRIMAYGDAGYFGSIATVRLRGAIVGMAPTADGRGYWLAARDGGVFAFGDARFKGSRPGRLMALGRISPSTGPERVIGMATTVCVYAPQPIAIHLAENTDATGSEEKFHGVM